MRNRWIMLLLGGFAVIALLAAACAPASESDSGDASGGDTTTGGGDTSDGGGTTPDATVSVSGVPLDPDARYGGTLSVAVTSEGPTFSNWEEAAGSAPMMGHPVANMLVSKQDWGTLDDFADGAYWNITPDLAKSWEQSSDGLQWTFNLRDGVEFSDGVPFTCADVKWSFDTIRTGEGLNRSPRSVHFNSVENITCADNLTVVFNLNRGKSSFLEIVGLPYHVIKPKHLYENDTDLMRSEPNKGTGPFILGEWLPGEKTTFVRNNDYWDAPFPYLDAIEVRILSNQAQVAALRAGQLHVGGSAGAWSGVRADLLIKECDVCQIWSAAAHPGMMFSVIPNFERAPWNTQELRDVVSLAIDRQKEIDLGYNGWIALGTGGLYLPGSFFAMPESMLQDIPGHDFRDPAANKEQASQILADAGYAPNELSVNIVHAPFYADYVVTVIEDLRAVGIDADADQQETARYYDAMSSGNFDLAGHAGWIGGFDPDFILYEYFYTDSARNYGKYSNPEVDRLIDEQSLTLDPEERRQKAWEVGEILLRDQVRTLGGFQRAIPVYSNNVRGVIPTVPSQSYGNFYRHAHTWLTE